MQYYQVFIIKIIMKKGDDGKTIITVELVNGLEPLTC